MVRILKHKYHAIRCESDGKKFPSRLEMRYYHHLQMRQKAGEILFFLRQVPFDLPAVKYYVDFMIFFSDGTIEFVDCKGIRTPVSDIKIKQVEELYPITIKIVTRV